MAKKIVGYRKFNSKKGTACCIATLISPYNDRQIQSGACGSQVTEEFIPEQFHGLFNPQVIGKNCDFAYDVVGGKAYITNVTIG